MHIHSTIIERDPARCRVMKTLLPEATIICADGTKPDVLREEGLPEADALVTLTESDETNLIISSFAYHEQVPKIVTKVDEDNFIELAESYGLTTIIQPADVTAGRIVEYVRWMQNSAHSSGVETLRMVADGQAEALEFIVRAESQFLDVPLKALKLKDSVLVASIIRRGKCRVPSGNDAIELGDRVIVVGEAPAVHNVEKVLGNAEKNLNEPNIAAIFIGIILGLAVGAVPLHLPGISALSEGTRTILLTVAISGAAAVLFPVRQEENEDDA